MRQFLLSLGLLLCCVTAALAQNRVESPVIPLEDSAYTDVVILYQNGIIEDNGYESADYDHWPRYTLRRYEFAIMIARLLRNDLAAVAAPPTHGPLLPNHGEGIAALRRLVKKFLPELKALGIHTERIKFNGVLLIQPENNQPNLHIAPPFIDVPKDHWAYEAVETLRQAGIMVGVPAGDKTLFNSPITK